MKGRTKENIEDTMKKMHAIAECTFDQKLEVINSYIDDEGLGVPNKANIGKECQIGEYAWVYDPDTQHLTLVIK